MVNGAIDDCMPHMRTIGKCFQEGQYALPGPPTNLQVILITPKSIFGCVYFIKTKLRMNIELIKSTLYFQVTPINANSAVASWDPPIKNPNFAEVYRLIWRKPGDR